MADSEAKRRWMAENTIQVSIKLNRRTDADILAAIADKPKQTELKRLIRLGLQQQQDRVKGG